MGDDGNMPISINKEITISSFNTIDYYNLNKDFYQLPDSHPYWEMVYVDRGDVISNYDGMGHTLVEGQVVFHPPHSSHSHISNKRVSNSILVVSFTSDSGFLDNLQRKIFSVTDTSKKFLSLFMEECRTSLSDITNTSGGIPKPLCFQGEARGSSQLLECYFVSFLLSIIRNDSYKTIEKNSASRSIISTSFAELLKSYLNDNVYRNLTLEDLCRKFNLSQSNLCKRWKEYSDTGVIEYFISLKIKEAKHLIRQKKYNFTQIADMLGYSTIHHFSHTFKKIVGMSPSEYKKSLTIKENGDENEDN